MRKLFLIIILFQIISLKAYSQIVYIDMNFILNNSQVGKFLNNYLNTINDKKLLELKEIESQIIKKEQSLIAKQNIIEKKEFEKKLSQLSKEVQKYRLDKKLGVISKFKDERLQYFGKKLLYMEKPEVLSKEDYNLIHKDTAKKLLSTNNEKWNTIPRTYSEIDTLRAKFEKQDDKEKLKILDDINAYVEDLEKHYSSA